MTFGKPDIETNSDERLASARARRKAVSSVSHNRLASCKRSKGASLRKARSTTRSHLRTLSGDLACRRATPRITSAIKPKRIGAEPDTCLSNNRLRPSRHEDRRPTAQGHKLGKLNDQPELTLRELKHRLRWRDTRRPNASNDNHKLIS